MNPFFIQTNGEDIFLYMTNPKGKENSYLRYELHHCVLPFTGGVYENMDQWRLYSLDTFEKVDGKMVQTLSYPLVNGGEWECAIQIDGLRDFHGGIHGYEHHTTVSAKLNGADFDFCTPYEGWADSFDFYQESNIIKQETADEVIAHHTKQYHFADGKVTLHQKLEWVQSFLVRVAYLTMLPLRRTSDDTPEGEQISDRIQVDHQPTIYDITAVGHNNGVSPSTPIPHVTHAKIWGEKLGVVCEVTVAKDCLQPESKFFVQNNESYNKLYFSHFSARDVVPGDVFENDTIFEIYRV